MFIVRKFRRHLPTEHDGFHGTDGPSQALQHGDVRLRTQQVRTSVLQMMTKSTSQAHHFHSVYIINGFVSKTVPFCEEFGICDSWCD